MTINIIYCNEFEKDFKHLSKKYQSLEQDIKYLIIALKTDGITLPHLERINNL